jgi:hypothetical protein
MSKVVKIFSAFLQKKQFLCGVVWSWESTHVRVVCYSAIVELTLDIRYSSWHPNIFFSSRKSRRQGSRFFNSSPNGSARSASAARRTATSRRRRASSAHSNGSNANNSSSSMTRYIAKAGGQCYKRYFSAIFAKFLRENWRLLENQCYDHYWLAIFDNCFSLQPF